MSDLKVLGGTYVGRVASVRGNLARVRLDDGSTTLLMVDGSSHRIGQLGSFARIPMGFVDLYGVVVQVGADVLQPADEPAVDALSVAAGGELLGYRWMTIALFGEVTRQAFTRGVSQYPTVGDQVHLTTADDLEVIYRSPTLEPGTVEVGEIAGSGNLPAELNLGRLVTRHSCIVGSTGSGKSNLVAVLLSAIARPEFPAARVLVVDPHGEYGTAIPKHSHVIHTRPGQRNDGALRVPYWALRLEDLLALTMGQVPDRDVEYIRERVREMKVDAASHLDPDLPAETITADSPLPFSIRRLWYELEDVERVTFKERASSAENRYEPESVGDAETLQPPTYPEASAYNNAPYLNTTRRNLRRQLDFMRSRLLDSRFDFMFATTDGWHPDLDGKIEKDLPELLASWVGSDKQVTILDVSGLPEETVGIVVGTLLNLIYEALFWAGDLPVSGRNQPLLVVIDEAHRFLPASGESPAARACIRISREGRKHGLGLMTVTQRPSDITPTVLSQAGTMLALRVTNASDRSAVAATVPDDLGGLIELLPSLRTGEGLVLGEAIALPSRVRFHRAPLRPHGEDPEMPDAWRHSRPDPADYAEAVRQWRGQRTHGREEV